MSRHVITGIAAFGFIIGAAIAAVVPCRLPAQTSSGREPEGVRVDVKETLNALIGEEDTDGDHKITVDDIHRARTGRGDQHFWLTAVDGSKYEISGAYYLANLLQELRLALEAGKDTAVIDPRKVFDRPTHHISRMIRDICWEGLTRRMDARGLLTILSDEKMKTADGCRYVYVPEEDTEAFDFYSHVAAENAAANIRVVKLPSVLTPEYLHRLEPRHGILSLDIVKDAEGRAAAVPYVVPGGRFNELYGWDSYFIVLGLLADEKTALARSMVDQQVYEINHYGKILNANRTYYLSRSQPPFLTSMVRAVYERLPKNDSTKAWLHRSIEAAVREYTHVWMGPDRLLSIGLSRYFDTGRGPCPEVEPGHYDDTFQAYAAKHHMPWHEFEKAWRSGRIQDPELDEYFVHDRAMRESGHDTSYRLINRAADLATIDLNSLLYKIETDIADVIEREFNDTFTLTDGTRVRTQDYRERAARRKALINTYCWDREAGIFYDYNAKINERTGYLSPASFYPLWAGLASKEQARSLVERALPALEQAGGVAASSEASRGPLSDKRKERQWDYPNGWPPHQMLLWHGLRRYGFDSVAQRLAYRWLYAMTLNAVQYNGTITEKLNVVTRTHAVFAEYGNVGTKFAYITREGFGWSNASYQVGLGLLSPGRRAELDRLIPPEWIFKKE
ncbi:MAG: trehalase family glycosidase [Acidobacteriota bacterium]